MFIQAAHETEPMMATAKTGWVSKYGAVIVTIAVALSGILTAWGGVLWSQSSFDRRLAKQEECSLEMAKTLSRTVAIVEQLEKRIGAHQ